MEINNTYYFGTDPNGWRTGTLDTIFPSDPRTENEITLDVFIKLMNRGE